MLPLLMLLLLSATDVHSLTLKVYGLILDYSNMLVLMTLPLVAALLVALPTQVSMSK